MAPSAAIIAAKRPGFLVFSSSSAFSAVICWEIVFPDLVRQFVQRGARFLVNASNEAWFVGTAMPDQMLAISVFRAVENRTALARAANVGISAIIDPHGRIMRRALGEGVLAGAIPLGDAGTFYTRHGDWFVLLCAVGSLAAIVKSQWPQMHNEK